MPGYSVGIETDSDDYITSANLVRQDHNLLEGLEDYEEPRIIESEHEPIRRVKVGSLFRYPSQRKTYWLYAEICPKHLGSGQHTKANKKLATAIRSRGTDNDDCGHIIANSLGGKMVEFNLFPQTAWVNRGMHGWRAYWRAAVEISTIVWLQNRNIDNPKVKFEVRLFYNDTNYKDRPSGGKLFITFEGYNRQAEKAKSNNSDRQSWTPLFASLKGELINRIQNQLGEPGEPDVQISNPEILSEFAHMNHEKISEFLVQFLQDLIRETSMNTPPRPPPTTTNITMKA